MKNKSLVIISLVLLLVGFAAVTYVYKNNQNKKVEELASKTSNGAPFVREHSMKLGENKKNIVVVEFLDPECEACGYFANFMNKAFKEHYEDIQFVVRYLDNHKNSKYAVKIIEASRAQGMYKEVLNTILLTQNKWAVHGFTKPELIWEFLAKIDGLDMNKLKADFEKINVDEILKLDRQDATTLNVRGTPTVFVNGKKLDRLAYDSLVNLIENEIYK